MDTNTELAEKITEVVNTIQNKKALEALYNITTLVYRQVLQGKWN